MAKELWNDFEVETFIFEDRYAKIVYPNVKPNGKLLIKTEYWDAFPNFEIEMVKRGYYLCFIRHFNRWGAPAETTVTANFIKFVANKLGIEPRCIPVGMSCGGLQAANLAIMYPELVSVMYIDAPVLNLISQAGLGAHAPATPEYWEELRDAYGVDKSSIVTFRDSPIDHMDVLVKHNIPIIMLYGNADTTVIYSENGKVLEDYYNKHGAPIKVIPKSMVGHHPHGLDDPTPIIEFVEKYC